MPMNKAPQDTVCFAFASLFEKGGFEFTRHLKPLQIPPAPFFKGGNNQASCALFRGIFQNDSVALVTRVWKIPYTSRIRKITVE